MPNMFIVGSVYQVLFRALAREQHDDAKSRHMFLHSIRLVAVYAATAVGLVDLIAKGYGTLTWYFLAIYVLPLMTWGVWLLWRRRSIDVTPLP